MKSGRDLVSEPKKIEESLVVWLENVSYYIDDVLTQGEKGGGLEQAIDFLTEALPSLPTLPDPIFFSKEPFFLQFKSSHLTSEMKEQLLSLNCAPFPSSISHEPSSALSLVCKSGRAFVFSVALKEGEREANMWRHFKNFLAKETGGAWEFQGEIFQFVIPIPYYFLPTQPQTATQGKGGEGDTRNETNIIYILLARDDEWVKKTSLGQKGKARDWEEKESEKEEVRGEWKYAQAKQKKYHFPGGGWVSYVRDRDLGDTIKRTWEQSSLGMEEMSWERWFGGLGEFVVVEEEGREQGKQKEVLSESDSQPPNKPKAPCLFFSRIFKKHQRYLAVLLPVLPPPASLPTPFVLTPLPSSHLIDWEREREKVREYHQEGKKVHFGKMDRIHFVGFDWKQRDYVLHDVEVLAEGKLGGGEEGGGGGWLGEFSKRKLRSELGWGFVEDYETLKKGAGKMERLREEYTKWVFSLKESAPPTAIPNLLSLRSLFHLSTLLLLLLFSTYLRSGSLKNLGTKLA